jgi:hypothetical protein
MQFRHLISAVAFSALAMASSFSQAATVLTFNLNTTTLGQLVSGISGGLAAEGFTLNAGNAEAAYQNYLWSPAGESIVGTSAFTGINATLVANIAIATGGTVSFGNLSNGSFTAFSQLDALIDNNIGNLIAAAQFNPSIIPALAGLSLSNIQGGLPFALGANDNLQITLVSAVPEPGEWAMMLSGLAVVGVMARRRRQSKQ